MRRRFGMYDHPPVISEEERKIRDARPRLPKTDVGRDTGLVFYMAFVYTPTGTQIFTGDLEHIYAATGNLPTCHGWIVPYRGKQQSGKGSPWLFGKLSYSFGLHDAYPRMYLSQRGRFSRLNPEFKRRCYQLLYYQEPKGQPKVVATLRRLPKQYIRALKAYA